MHIVSETQPILDWFRSIQVQNCADCIGNTKHQGDYDMSSARLDTRENSFLQFFSSPIIWGAILTATFYSLLPMLPVGRALAMQYFCGHPLEYVSTALFFVGVAVLIGKLFQLNHERAALKHAFISRLPASNDDMQMTKSDAIRSQLLKLPKNLQRTWLSRRIDDTCTYVSGQNSSAGLEEHLKYLAELAAEQLQRSFALIRTISWAVPIVGFLGTVLGITIAIANIAPGESVATGDPQAWIGEVASGLSVAFDTTALALALSLVLVITAFLVEQAEQAVLMDVEKLSINRLIHLFPDPAQESPLIAAEQQAAEKLLAESDILIRRQTELWQQSLEAMRTSWQDTLQQQQGQLQQSLQQGVADTLSDHDQQLQMLRLEFVSAFETASSRWQQAQETSLSAQQSLQQQFDQLHEQSQAFLQFLQQHQQLAESQQLLAQNLEKLQEVRTFEELLQSLNAAVNLLAARTHSQAA